MQALTSIATLVIQTLATVYLSFVVLRFLLQLARADFYNPISQSVVKITNPVLMPLRKIIPGFFGLDIACIVLGILVGFIAIELNVLAVYQHLFNPLIALAWAAIGLLSFTVTIIFWSVIVMVIASFIAPGSYHPALQLINQLLEPIRAPIYKIIPPMGGFDLSPIFILLFVKIIDILLQSLAGQVGLLPQLVPGYW